MEYTKVKLGDILTSISETISKEQQTAIFLNTSDISEGKFLHKRSSVVKELPGQAKKKIKNGDILFSEIRPKNKRYAVVDVSNPNDYVVSTKLMVLRIKDPSKYYLQYIYQQLISQKMLHQINEIAESRSGTFPQITFDAIKNIELTPPPLEEQKRIADIFTVLDDKIELNNQMNQTLEEIASLLYKRWFVDFEFPDDKGNPYKSSGGEMVDSELGMIPKGWEVKKLGEIELIITDFVSNGSFASLKANTKIYKEENYAVFVRNTDLKSGKFETYVDEKTYQFLSKSKLLGGEIIISNVGDVGSVFLCPRINKKMTLGNNVILVKSQESKIYWNYYLYIFLKSSLGKALLESITSGSAQMKFNITDFKKLKFIAPNFNTLEEFNKIFDKNIFLQNNYKAENTKLQTMKKELLKELI